MLPDTSIYWLHYRSEALAKHLVKYEYDIVTWDMRGMRRTGMNVSSTEGFHTMLSFSPFSPPSLFPSEESSSFLIHVYHSNVDFFFFSLDHQQVYASTTHEKNSHSGGTPNKFISHGTIAHQLRNAVIWNYTTSGTRNSKITCSIASQCNKPSVLTLRI